MKTVSYISRINRHEMRMGQSPNLRPSRKNLDHLNLRFSAWTSRRRKASFPRSVSEKQPPLSLVEIFCTASRKFWIQNLYVVLHSINVSAYIGDVTNTRTRS